MAQVYKVGIEDMKRIHINKWCKHIKWREDCESWFLFLDNIPNGMVVYIPVTDHYNFCPICGIAKPKEKGKI